MIAEERLYSTVGKLIRIAREKVRLSQEDLSTQLGLTRTSVSNFERGKQHIQLHTLYQIADILDVPVSDLLPTVELVTVKSEIPTPEQREIIERFLGDNEIGELGK